MSETTDAVEKATMKWLDSHQDIVVDAIATGVMKGIFVFFEKNKGTFTAAVATALTTTYANMHPRPPN